MQTDTKGNGGNITIDAGSLKLLSGAQLLASTFGQGNAGNVTITTKDAILLAGNVDIFSAVETEAQGLGGNIDINAAILTLQDGAQIAASTRGQGDAGNVTIVAKDTVTTADSSLILSTVEAGAVGKGGNIDINAANLILRDGAQYQSLKVLVLHFLLLGHSSSKAYGVSQQYKSQTCRH